VLTVLFPYHLLYFTNNLDVPIPFFFFGPLSTSPARLMKLKASLPWECESLPLFLFLPLDRKCKSCGSFPSREAPPVLFLTKVFWFSYGARQTQPPGKDFLLEGWNLPPNAPPFVPSIPVWDYRPVIPMLDGVN